MYFISILLCIQLPTALSAFFSALNFYPMQLDLSNPRLLSRCANCYQMAENEFLPLFCNRCDLQVPVLEEHTTKSNPGISRYIEIDFFGSVPEKLKKDFPLLLWLSYKSRENIIKAWQGVFSVSGMSSGFKSGCSLADKFESYARAVLPDYQCIHDVICCKVPKSYLQAG
jgi:hypothetical protein